MGGISTVPVREIVSDRILSYLDFPMLELGIKIGFKLTDQRFAEKDNQIEQVGSERELLCALSLLAHFH